MTVTDIIALCNAGYNHEQIMQLAQAQQMERMRQAANPQQMERMQQAANPQQMERMQQAANPQQMERMQQAANPQQMERMQQAANPQQMLQPDPYTAIMSELLGLKQAVQAGNLMQAQQPAQTMTADDIIANIIAPKPRKENE